MPSVTQLPEVLPSYEESQVQAPEDYFNRKHASPVPDPAYLSKYQPYLDSGVILPPVNYLSLTPKGRTPIPSPKTKESVVERPATPPKRPLNPAAPVFIPRPRPAASSQYIPQQPTMTSSRFAHFDMAAHTTPRQAASGVISSPYQVTGERTTSWSDEMYDDRAMGHWVEDEDLAGRR